MKWFRGNKKNAADNLLSAAKIYKDRNIQYGDSFVLVGRVMEGLFPDGITIKSAHDQLRYHLITWIVGKLVRYCQNFSEGGHKDSADDLVVYAAMLGFEDEYKKAEKENK